MIAAERWLIRLTWVLSAGLGLAFVVCDTSVWPWDPAYYGEVTLTLYHALRHEPNQLWGLMRSALGFKAPGITWIGMLWVPLTYLGLRVETALLLFVLCTGLLSALLVTRTAGYLSEFRTGTRVVALLHMVSAPLFVGLLYHYFTEHLQLLAVSVVIWAVLTPQSRISMVGWGTVGLALGMLAKVSTPLYIVAPSIVGLWKLYRPRHIHASQSWISTVFIFFVALLLSYGAYAWYDHNSEAIRTFLASTSSGPIAELYGSRAAFSDKFVHWTLWARGAFFVVSPLMLAWLGLVGFSFVALAIRRQKPTLFDYCAFLGLGQLMLILSVFSFQVNEETRYLLPALPYVALLSGYAVYSLRSVALAPLLALGIAQGYTVHSTSWGSSWTAPFIGTPWLKKVTLDPRQQVVLTEAVKHSCTQPTANHYVIVGLELPHFNANTAAFYSTKEMITTGYRCFYTSLGYAENDPDKAMARLDGLKPEAVLYLNSFTPPNTPDPFNVVSMEIRRRLEGHPQYRLEDIDAARDLVYFDRVD